MDTSADDQTVENATLDLDVFISVYAGRTKERRLEFIAKRCPSLRIEALKMLTTILATGNRPAEHQKYALQLAEASVLAGVDPIVAPTNDHVKAACATHAATLERLEAEHKKNKVRKKKKTFFPFLSSALLEAPSVSSSVPLCHRAAAAIGASVCELYVRACECITVSVLSGCLCGLSVSLSLCLSVSLPSACVLLRVCVSACLRLFAFGCLLPCPS